MNQRSDINVVHVFEVAICDFKFLFLCHKFVHSKRYYFPLTNIQQIRPFVKGFVIFIKFWKPTDCVFEINYSRLNS